MKRHEVSKTPIDIAVVGSGFGGWTCFLELKQSFPKKNIVLIEKGTKLEMSLDDKSVPYQSGITLFAKYTSTRRGKQGKTLTAEKEGGASSFTQLCLYDEVSSTLKQFKDCKQMNFENISQIYKNFYQTLAEQAYVDSSLNKIIIESALESNLTHLPDFEVVPVVRNSFGIPARYYKSGIHTKIMDLDSKGLDFQSSVLNSSEVIKINFDETKRPCALECRSPDNGAFELKLGKNAKVVLAGDAITNPLLLLRSGIGPEKILKNCEIPIVSNNGGVGQNLKERIGITVPLCFSEKVPMYQNANFFFSFNTLSIEMFKIINLPVAYLSTFFATNGWIKSSVIFLWHISEKLGFFKSANAPFVKYLKTYTIQFNNVDSTGSVKPQTNNIFGEPVITLNNLSSEKDFDNFDIDIQRCLSLLLSIIDKLGMFWKVFNKINIFLFSRKLFFGSVSQRRAYLIKNNHSVCHRVGTCAYGDVLGNDFSVNGIFNVYVSGVSALKNLPTSSPSLTSAVIGKIVGQILHSKISEEEKLSAEALTTR